MSTVWTFHCALAAKDIRYGAAADNSPFDVQAFWKCPYCAGESETHLVKVESCSHPVFSPEPSAKL